MRSELVSVISIGSLSVLMNLETISLSTLVNVVYNGFLYSCTVYFSLLQKKSVKMIQLSVVYYKEPQSALCGS